MGAPLRVRAAAALVAALLAAGVDTPPARALTLQPPRFTREQMEAAMGEGAAQSILLVYGTRDPAARELLRARAVTLARRIFGGDTTAVRADREVREADFAGRSVMLLGGPAENDWARALAGALPVEFGERSFRFFGRAYDRPGDAIQLFYPSPLDPKRFVMLLAGNSAAAVARRGGFGFGGEDWRIARDGELLRSGRFAQAGGKPWGYDASLDRDLEREREQFAAGLRSTGRGAVRVSAPAGEARAEAVREAAEALLTRLTRAGFGAEGRVDVTLYRSLEEKGTLTRNTRPEHLGDDGAVHIAFPAGRETPDLWSVAARRLVQLGGSRETPWLRPAAAWLAGRFEGEPLDRAVSRLYFGRALPTAAEAAARETAWRSPLRMIPARALLVRAVSECAGARSRAAVRAMLAPGVPGGLDSLCRAAGVEGARVGRRYAALADSLARAGQRAANPRAPRAWKPADGFQRGVCLAHAINLQGGYLSATCARELAALKAAGCDWVSISPFGYLPSAETPEIYPSTDGGPDEENDESLCEAAAHARALGIRVWLVPHLWTRGWVGDLHFGAGDWQKFFDAYREFLTHYALLAEREGMDGLMVGHELTSATAVSPERWRIMIADARRLYHGTLSYGANWDQEVDRIPFWDALDLVSVSFYYPLAEKPGATPAMMRAAATRALKGLRELSARVQRPVLVAEVGYAPHPGAPIKPWEEEDGGQDLEIQRACYEAFVAALDPADWIAGAYWWKWFTSPAQGGPRDPSFTPRGKPAEAVMKRALHDWEGRPVILPAAPRARRL